MNRTIISLILFIMALLPCPGAQAAPASQDNALRGNLYEVTAKEAAQAVARAIEQKGVANHVDATLAGRSGQPLYAAPTQPAVVVKTLEVDKPTGRWSANLLFVSGDEVLSSMPAAGRFEETIEVPVLKRQFRSGEVIAADDVELTSFPVERVRKDTVSDAKDFVGKTPRRIVSAYRPVRADELSAPAVLKRNTIVQMRYRTPHMEITTTGQALDAGAPGDVVSIRNLNSKIVVRAVVETANTVSVDMLAGDKLEMSENAHEAH